MFTTVIPEAMILVGTRRKFGGSYKNERGKTFIVVIDLFWESFSLSGPFTGFWSHNF